MGKNSYKLGDLQAMVAGMKPLMTWQEREGCFKLILLAAFLCLLAYCNTRPLSP